MHNTGINTSLLVEHTYNPIHRRYQYDPAGELVRTLDKLRGEIKYEYEANGQLRSRDTGSLIGSEEFRYDPAANRLDFNARQFDKVKDNRIKQWRDQEYRYDPWGNLVEKRSGHSKLQHFSYDCENRLVRAETLVNGKLESQGEYRYDSLGRRIAKQAEINGEVEQKRFLWQGLRMLREETPGQSILYLYEPGSYAPLARVDQVEGEGQKVYYFHTDQIGTPLELTDSLGEVVWQATYRSWGAVEQLSASKIEQNLRFQGQYFDGETGLNYNIYRFYDSESGRFITQDPIGLTGSLNLYQYAVNPMIWIDPWGLTCSTDAKALRANMVAAGKSEPAFKNSAHHIVMSNSSDVRMVALQTKMERLRIDINAAENGIFLPSNSKVKLPPGSTLPNHASIHTNAYKQKVFDRLGDINNSGDFLSELNKINSEIALGIF
ncbi:putative deoxyribonuclease RhsC [compost metagenome]